jgi:hypothetical protein
MRARTRANNLPEGILQMPLHSHHSQVPERFRETARIGACQSAWVYVFVFRRLFPYGLSVTSLPVGKPLSDHALQSAFGPLYVIAAKPNAVSITEIELRKIPMQMLFLAVLVDALHAALEDRKVAFHGVGVHDTEHVFFCGVRGRRPALGRDRIYGLGCRDWLRPGWRDPRLAPEIAGTADLPLVGLGTGNAISRSSLPEGRPRILSGCGAVGILWARVRTRWGLYFSIPRAGWSSCIKEARGPGLSSLG